ncbi:endonuclease/exonuclease/phosphatase family protein [Stutzerimonas marianensis]|uniref:endonuclease/exonuclease/phosphatase family protein n=1 Tax=Stutzerimonas marianensis TaxID=2929513 RepID=UPI003C2CBC45
MTRRRVILLSLASSLLLLLMLAAAPWLLAWRPAAHEAAPTACTGRAPAVLAGQALKVMSWNIGHLAGPTPTGERVEPERLERNLRAVVATILEQEPDILLLQAVDDGDSRTGGADQLAALQASLGNRYPCSSSAFYRQARWLPSPDMFASAGTRLAILSRYRLEHGERLQLPLAKPSAFGEQHALQRVELPIRRGGAITLGNLLLDDGTDEQAQRQGDQVQRWVGGWLAEGRTLLLGGDFASWRRPPSPGHAPIAEIPDLTAPSPEDPSRVLSPGASPLRTRIIHSVDIKRLDALQPPQASGVSPHAPLVVRLLLPAGG